MWNTPYIEIYVIMKIINCIMKIKQNNNWYKIFISIKICNEQKYQRNCQYK